MGRTLSLLALLPPSNDGELTAEERQEAQHRVNEGRARAAAAQALLRKKAGERLKRQEVVDVIDEQVRAADERLRALRALDEQLRQDQRLNELWRLRREGWSLGDAMAEIDRRFPGPPAIEGG
jgi:benzoyl-CoA reductase/2-hydroxyglutaryl-CoA dehydratase subunit BcrC/BadD/HgdB